MAFPTDTIRLEAAQKIFAGITIEPVMISGKIAYYQTEFNRELFKETSITALCSAL